MSKKIRKCPGCGVPTEDGFFCPKCTEEIEKEESRKNIYTNLAGIIAAVGLIGALISFLFAGITYGILASISVIMWAAIFAGIGNNRKSIERINEEMEELKKEIKKNKK